MNTHSARLGLAAAALLFAFPASAQTIPPLEVPSSASCPAKIGSDKVGLVLGCWCDPSAMKGSVWGSDPYTNDSSICAAALHSGAVSAEGGPVVVQVAPGADKYTGSDANGVKSSDYGSWRASITFAEMATSIFGTGGGGQSLLTCPSAANKFAGDTTEMSCECPMGSMAGTVWGTGVYTDDSSVCAAALHAGVIGKDGGAVSIVFGGRVESFEGSVANGITSKPYGAWNRTFTFAGAAEACPSAATEIPSGTTEATCSCAPSATGGTVWGTGAYTDDSSICGAAVHAGAIGADGGTVTVVIGGRRASFDGSTANGITSQPYGPWNRSFTFK